MPFYGLTFSLEKRSVAVTQHHVAASYWVGVLAWYNATGLVET